MLFVKVMKKEVYENFKRPIYDVVSKCSIKRYIYEDHCITFIRMTDSIHDFVHIKKKLFTAS